MKHLIAVAFTAATLMSGATFAQAGNIDPQDVVGFKYPTDLTQFKYPETMEFKYPETIEFEYPIKLRSEFIYK